MVRESGPCMLVTCASLRAKPNPSIHLVLLGFPTAGAARASSPASPRSATAKAAASGALAGHLRRPGGGMYWAPAATRLRGHQHESHRRARGREHRVAVRILPGQGRDRRAGGGAPRRSRAAPPREGGAVSSRLLEFSQQVRSHAGGLVRQEISPATMRLIVNLTSSTIMQLVLDPPADVTRDELLDELGLRIAAWIR